MNGQFIKKPNLPEGNVKAAILNCNCEPINKYIESFNIEIIKNDFNSFVDKRIASHADISVHHLENNCIICNCSQVRLKHKLEEIGMNVQTSNFKSGDLIQSYPNDCSLNFARIGNSIIGKMSAMDSNLKFYSNLRSLRKIDANQGYCKCSTAIVTENAFITDDVSIYKAGIANGFDCLLVSKGNVLLDGFNYGFIGGTCTKISKNEMIFFGDLTCHSDCEAIINFNQAHGIKTYYLKDCPLYDIGGAVPIIEDFC